MKKSISFLMFCVMTLCILVSCQEKEKEAPKPVAPPPVKKDVYQPKHQATTIDLKEVKTYNYYNAPTDNVASAVVVNYNPKTPYAEPIVVKYSYSNGDTYSYTIPQEFGLWPNEAGKLRVVSDNDCTVWLQGQTKSGKFKEFIFYGNPKFNNKKIKPNSYLNHPNGLIKYCE